VYQNNLLVGSTIFLNASPITKVLPGLRVQLQRLSYTLIRAEVFLGHGSFNKHENDEELRSGPARDMWAPREG
jgi:hypothetical protein